VLGTKSEFPTKRLAERRMDLFLARINAPNYKPVRVSTLEEFAERWKVEILTKQKPSAARAAHSHLQRHIVPYLGKLRLDQIGVENQQTFVSSISNGISRKTVVNVLGTLSSMLNTAKDWGYACDGVSLGKLALPERNVTEQARFFTADEARRIIAAADEPWRTMFTILAMTGLRAGECLGLQWGDIDFERRRIHVRRSSWYGRIQTPKSKGSEAVLPMPAPLTVVLKSFREQWKPNLIGFLFVTKNNRPPSSNKVVEYRLWPILDKLKIPRCGLHAFRHTVASILVDSGAPVTVAQAQLRHSDAKTTLGYAHSLDDSQRRAMEKVASILDPSGPNSSPSNQLIQ
jgi:integrase